MKRMAIVFVIALGPALLAQAISLKPGQYEVVSVMAPAGRATGMPPRKDLHCYTPQELDHLSDLMAKKDKGCNVVKSNVAGSALSFVTECSSPDGSKMTITGDVTFASRESYHSVVNMKQTAGPPTPFAQGMTVTTDAKRIGECAK